MFLFFNYSFFIVFSVRIISTVQLQLLLVLHPLPIYAIVFGYPMNLTLRLRALDAFSAYPFVRNYSAVPFRQQIYQRDSLGGPCVQSKTFCLVLFPSRYKPIGLATIWTQITFGFNLRTEGPLRADTPSGCQDSTSLLILIEILDYLIFIMDVILYTSPQLL